MIESYRELQLATLGSTMVHQEPNQSHASVEVTCKNRHSFHVKRKYAGQVGRCPECSTTVNVPYVQDTIDSDQDLDVTEDILKDSDAAKSESKETRQFGRFRFKKKIGEGSYGTVFLAHDPRLDRNVAVKLPRSGIFRGHDGDKFLREARAAASLRHPNIVPIYDAGIIGGMYYISSAFIAPGRTLRQRIQKEKLDHIAVVETVRKLASALAYSHALGIIHRDIKPANILLDENIQPYLVDFGLAVRTQTDQQSENRMIVGTPHYMSPEQADGRTHDARSDIWSLGVVMYEMLARRRPFEVESLIQLRYAVRHTDPVMLSEIDHTIPFDLQSICMKCLHRDPELRYADCQELAEDLRRWQNDETLIARPGSIVERSRRWFRKNSKVAALGICVFALLLATVAAAATSSVMISQRNAQLKAAVDKKETQAGRLIQVSDEEETKQRELEKQNLVLAEAQKENADKAKKLKSKANELKVKKASLRDKKDQLDRLDNQIAEVRLQIKRLNADAKLTARQAAESEENIDRIDQQKQWDTYTRLLQQAQDEIESGDKSTATSLLNQCSPEFRSWEWNYLREWCQGESPYFLDIPVGSEDAEVRHLTMTPDGRFIGLAGYDSIPLSQKLEMWNIVANKRAFYWHGIKGGVDGVSLHPTGKYIAMTTHNQRRVVILEERLNNLPRIWRREKGSAAWFHPDGEVMRIVNSDGEQWEIDIESERKKKLPGVEFHPSTRNWGTTKREHGFFNRVVSMQLAINNAVKNQPNLVLSDYRAKLPFQVHSRVCANQSGTMLVVGEKMYAWRRDRFNEIGLIPSSEMPMFYSSDGLRLISAATVKLDDEWYLHLAAGHLIVRDTQSGTIVARLDLPSQAEFRTPFATTADGEVMAWTIKDGKGIRVWVRQPEMLTQMRDRQFGDIPK